MLAILIIYYSKQLPTMSVLCDLNTFSNLRDNIKKGWSNISNEYMSQTFAFAGPFPFEICQLDLLCLLV